MFTTNERPCLTDEVEYVFNKMKALTLLFKNMDLGLELGAEVPRGIGEIQEGYQNQVKALLCEQSEDETWCPPDSFEACLACLQADNNRVKALADLLGRCDLVQVDPEFHSFLFDIFTDLANDIEKHLSAFSSFHQAAPGKVSGKEGSDESTQS